MVLVTAEDKRQIAEAIALAERDTSGDIVAVIAPDSGSYWHVPFLWAGLVALAVPWPLIFWTWWPVERIYLVQLAVFAGLLLILAHRPLRLALVPRSLRYARAHRRAVGQFLAQNLYTGVGNTGVLIFVSVAEGYAEILADSAIDAKVPRAQWDAIVADLTEHIGRGRPADGFVRAIGAIGEHLARHYPPRPGAAKSLANHLIVLPPV